MSGSGANPYSSLRRFDHASSSALEPAPGVRAWVTVTKLPRPWKIGLPRWVSMPRMMCAWWPNTASAPASIAARATGFSYIATTAGVCPTPLCSDTRTTSACSRSARMSSAIASRLSGSAKV